MQKVCSSVLLSTLFLRNCGYLQPSPEHLHSPRLKACTNSRQILQMPPTLALVLGSLFRFLFSVPVFETNVL